MTRRLPLESSATAGVAPIFLIFRRELDRLGDHRRRRLLALLLGNGGECVRREKGLQYY
ncbi:MAG: hypothetical protein MZV64_28835 [Ignavibacteriales bacterium]|nr:hypothetical protein [Ignavibacteriales bacterium]